VVEWRTHLRDPPESITQSGSLLHGTWVAIFRPLGRVLADLGPFRGMRLSAKPKQSN